MRAELERTNLAKEDAERCRAEGKARLDAVERQSAEERDAGGGSGPQLPLEAVQEQLTALCAPTPRTSGAPPSPAGSASTSGPPTARPRTTAPFGRSRRTNGMNT
ncbi:hypothetical protein LRS74_05230 [Streptomyces sp. LX-29]|uniref:hypothetical protein n=1 Tax=Streptomyces sp. LX-29 TaxID=2900152 RepID=UPI00240E551E|nr:hypothetical protein [Streptomyces sp. LX-29]WFB06510.1 hypothetical protein LRS74_05230 [Streptomyces sp. LX-29]